MAFVAELCRGVALDWHGRLLDGDTLAIFVPLGKLPDGSKELFVRVLEYAEEELGVSRVLVCLAKEHDPMLVRAFLYLGFSLLAPSTFPASLDPNTLIVMQCML